MIVPVAVVFLCFVAPSLSAPGSPVFKLTDQDFDRFLQDKEVMLVDFYAPWCSDCEKLKPNFEQAAVDLASQKKFVMAKVDCFGAGRYICSNRFQVHQWPTLKVFKYGIYGGDYTGPQDKDSLEAFVNGQMNKGQQQYDQRANGLPAVGKIYSNEYPDNGWTYTPVSGNVQG